MNSGRLSTKEITPGIFRIGVAYESASDRFVKAITISRTAWML
jgi:hypothetical protein